MKRNATRSTHDMALDLATKAAEKTLSALRAAKASTSDADMTGILSDLRDADRMNHAARVLCGLEGQP